jgi:hypothetical protein
MVGELPGAKEAQAVIDEIAKLVREDSAINSKLQALADATPSSGNGEPKPILTLVVTASPPPIKPVEARQPTGPRSLDTDGGTADAGTSGSDYSVEFNSQNGGASSSWPHWAFELAKAALRSQQCSMAEALEAVTRSGGREGSGGGPVLDLLRSTHAGKLTGLQGSPLAGRRSAALIHRCRPTEPRTRPIHFPRSFTHQSRWPAGDHVAIWTSMGGSTALRGAIWICRDRIVTSVMTLARLE